MVTAFGRHSTRTRMGTHMSTKVVVFSMRLLALIAWIGRREAGDGACVGMRPPLLVCKLTTRRSGASRGVAWGMCL